MPTERLRLDRAVLGALRGFANAGLNWSPVSTALFELRRLGEPVDTTSLLNLLIGRGYVAYNDAHELTITSSGRSELIRLSA